VRYPLLLLLPIRFAILDQLAWSGWILTTRNARIWNTRIWLVEVAQALPALIPGIEPILSTRLLTCILRPALIHESDSRSDTRSAGRSDRLSASAECRVEDGEIAVRAAASPASPAEGCGRRRAICGLLELVPRWTPSCVLRQPEREPEQRIREGLLMVWGAEVRGDQLEPNLVLGVWCRLQHGQHELVNLGAHLCVPLSGSCVWSAVGVGVAMGRHGKGAGE
jgi:hypothetical protein